ncbi:MAG: CoA transferase [Acidimicrobiales bacterium]
MPGARDGVKVVELGLWLAGPACGAILADWGADVIKIEPLAGDPFRGTSICSAGRSTPPV